MNTRTYTRLGTTALTKAKLLSNWFPCTYGTQGRAQGCTDIFIS